MQSVVLGLIAIPTVLLAAPSVCRCRFGCWVAAEFSPFTRRLMVWGGMRGAISVALAFSVPAGPERDLFLVMTYVVVVFSIIVQGLTVGRLAARAGQAQAQDTDADAAPDAAKGAGP